MKRWIKLNGPLVLLAFAILIGFIWHGLATGLDSKAVFSITGFLVASLIAGFLLAYFAEKRRDSLIAEMNETPPRRHRQKRRRWLRFRSHR